MSLDFGIIPFNIDIKVNDIWYSIDYDALILICDQDHYMLDIGKHEHVVDFGDPDWLDVFHQDDIRELFIKVGII